ncbi:MAG: Type II secretion system protein E [Parcubacteria group bacterium GW2011_GWA2_50_10]|nr:MAG: Type II secretion system protein E [Parcubacteria group bacterium GW2011_GWA2_50_10]
MGAEPFLISSTLNAVIAQRLVRRLSGEKEKYKLSAKDVQDLAEYCNEKKVIDLLLKEKIIKPKETLQDVVFFKPRPSSEAPDGYQGRIGIYEVLPVTESIKELIVSRATSDKIQGQAEQEGMVTMVEDGIVKAAQGLTTIEEVLRVITE